MPYKPTRHEINTALWLYGIGDKPPPQRRRKAPSQRSNPTEAQEQSALFAWARSMEGRYPELSLLHHIPNGGNRDAITGAHLKAQGVRAGVPDLSMPVPRGRFHGLYIELKAARGRVQDTQRQWIERLTAQGYKALVCFGAEEAKVAIITYLEGSHNAQTP